MTPEVQVGTILIEEPPPLFVSGAAGRTIFLPDRRERCRARYSQQTLLR
jgi:hypothetical protein